MLAIAGINERLTTTSGMSVGTLAEAARLAGVRPSELLVSVLGTFKDCNGADAERLAKLA